MKNDQVPMFLTVIALFRVIKIYSNFANHRAQKYLHRKLRSTRRLLVFKKNNNKSRFFFKLVNDNEPTINPCYLSLREICALSTLSFI